MIDTNITPKEAMAKAREIVFLVNTGQLSYDDGKKAAMPYLDIINARSKEIAKKYNQRPTNIVSFAGLRR